MHKPINSLSLTLAAVAALALFTASTASGQNATLRGTVNYAGEQSATVVDMNADPSCAALHSGPVLLDTLVTDDAGHLANAFVYLKNDPSLGRHAVPEESHLLDQHGCLYTPHVSGIQVGQTLVIRNSDTTLHNVHAVPKEAREFNFGQPFQGMEIEQVFKSSEIMIPFKCDVHPWMSAYVGVLEHPFFAVSAADGTFSIEGIPAGTYTLEVWHEKLGTRSLTVTLQDSATEDVAINF